MIQGRDLILKVNGVPVAAAKSCTLDISHTYIGVASPIEGKWSRSVPEKASWNASTECLMARADNANLLMQTLADGTAVTVQLVDTTSGMNLSGIAYIESASIQANVGSLARFSIKLTGSGAISGFSRPIWPKDTIYSDRIIKTDMAVADRDDACIYYGVVTFTHQTLVKISLPAECILLEGPSTLKTMIDADNIDHTKVTEYSDGDMVTFSSGTHYFADSEIDAETSAPRMIAYS